MKVKINRIAVAVHDVRKAIKVYERLLGVKFHRAGPAVVDRTGLSVAASLDGGMELITPLPDSDNVNARAVRNFLETRGEGIFSVCYEVDNLEEADRRAEAENLPLTLKLNFTSDEIAQEFSGAFNRFEESCYDGTETLGHGIAYNLIDYKTKSPRPVP